MIQWCCFGGKMQKEVKMLKEKPIEYAKAEMKVEITKKIKL